MRNLLLASAGTVGAIAILLSIMSLGVFQTNNNLAADTSLRDSKTDIVQEHTSSESPKTISEREETFPEQVEDTMKYFLIGYEYGITVETANKVSIDDHPWLSPMIENGETMVTAEVAKEFFNDFRNNTDFAVQMSDGTTKYYDVDLYNVPFAPNVPYVKAFWVNDIGGKASEKILLSDFEQAGNTWLKTAIEQKSTWVPIENPEEAIAMEQFLAGKQVKSFEVEDSDGNTALYNIRYVSAGQTFVS